MSSRPNRPRVVSRMIVDQIDPNHLVPGGTDTCIQDVVRFGGGNRSISLIGVTADNDLKLGRWVRTELGGRTIDFMPVARLSRHRKADKLRVPDSFKLALGLLRYRRRFPTSLWQVHRVELGWIASVLSQRGFVQFIHNDSKGLLGGASDSIWKHLPAIYRRLEKRVLQKAKSVVVFNRPDGARILSERPDAVVSQTWFDPEVFRPYENDPPRPNSVCWIGRLEQQKDPVLAVQVFAEIARQEPDAVFTMIGDGSLMGAVKAELRERELAARVRLSGPLPREDVAREMSRHSVMLMTSHYEGSPRVLAEANAVGTPVVATAGADPDNALVEGINGIQATTREPSVLASAVLRAWRSDARQCRNSVSHRSAPVMVEAILRHGEDQTHRPSQQRN